jgi:aldose sugar dehydrogenase
MAEAPEPVRGLPPPPQPAKAIKTGYKVTEIAKGLDHPWSMAFLPDGSMLVTERVGRLRVIKNGSLQAEPIGGVPAVHTGSQAGLFDIVLHPNFAQNNIVYLTYAAGTTAANGTQVARALRRQQAPRLACDFQGNALEGYGQSLRWANGLPP